MTPTESGEKFRAFMQAKVAREARKPGDTFNLRHPQRVICLDCDATFVTESRHPVCPNWKCLSRSVQPLPNRQFVVQLTVKRLWCQFKLRKATWLRLLAAKAA